MRFKPIHAITLIVLVVLLLVVYFFPSSESFVFQCNQDVQNTMRKNMQKCTRDAWDKNDLRMKKKCYQEYNEVLRCCNMGTSPTCSPSIFRPVFDLSDLEDVVSTFSGRYFTHAPSGLILFPFNVNDRPYCVDVVVYDVKHRRKPERVRLQFNSAAPPFLKGVILRQSTSPIYVDPPTGVPIVNFSLDPKNGALTLDGLPTGGLWNSPSTPVKKQSIRFTSHAIYPAVNGVGTYFNDDSSQVVIVPPTNKLQSAIVLPATAANGTIVNFTGEWIALTPDMITQHPSSNIRSSLMTLHVMNQTFELSDGEVF